MTGSEIFILFGELLAGRTMDETAFYQLLNAAKNARERRRPWVILRTEDGSNTVTPATVYTTQFTLPDRFIRCYGKYPLKLVSGSTVLDYEEVPFAERHRYQNTPGKFAIDHKNGKFYIMGSVGESYTAYLNFIQHSPDIASGTEWAGFPDDAGALLAFDVAVSEKGGISYDDINARMTQYHGRDARAIESSLVMWDANLQVNAAGV